MRGLRWGWLNYLGQQLPADGSAGAATSGKSVKGVIRTLLLSQSFAQKDPAPDQCYDYAPGAPPSSLPCQIAWTITANCATCHSGDGASGGLDLTTWKDIPGVGETFVHLDDHGQQIAKATTFALIKDRLSNPDKNLRMPKNRDMSAADLSRLYHWVDGVSSGLAPASTATSTSSATEH